MRGWRLAVAGGEERARRGSQGRVSSFKAVAKSVPVAVQIANQLVAGIRAGELPVGTRLPSEAVLAERFGVSRASVREALSSLQFSGYVETAQGSGTVVVSTTAIGQSHGGESGIRRASELIDVLEARLLIEPEVIRQGAMFPLPSAIRTAERMLEGMQLALDGAGHDSQSDLGLHRALVRSCRNPTLVDTAERLLAQTEGPLWRKVRDHAWADDQLPKLWLTQHIAMADAVMRNDPGRAEKASREHLRSVLSNAGRSMRLTTRDRERLAVLLDVRVSDDETHGLATK